MVLLRFREVGRKFHCYVRFLTVTVNLLKNLMFTVLDNPPSRPSYKYFGFHYPVRFEISGPRRAS